MMNLMFAKRAYHPMVWVFLIILLFLATGIADAYAHGVAEGDQGYVRIGYNWSVRGGVVNYDTHADAPGIDYHAYGKGKQSGGENGTLVAAFDGKHGWFWRNRTENSVTIVLKTSGAYTDIKRVG